MSDAFTRAQALIRERLAAQEGPVIAALEGGAATGKTTLAAALSAAFQAPVISMDDFFLPPALRTPQRLKQPGGNIHYERFEEEVAAPLRAGIPFSYRVYDCHTGTYAAEKRVERAPLVLVEGVYSLHPRYQDIYTLRLLLRTAPQTQDARLRARGDWLYRRFQESWLPLEQSYFAARDIPSLCDLVLDT